MTNSNKPLPSEGTANTELEQMLYKYERMQYATNLDDNLKGYLADLRRWRDTSLLAELEAGYVTWGGEKVIARTKVSGQWQTMDERIEELRAKIDPTQN